MRGKILKNLSKSEVDLHAICDRRYIRVEKFFLLIALVKPLRNDTFCFIEVEYCLSEMLETRMFVISDFGMFHTHK
jgi:hypothetical protein